MPESRRMGSSVASQHTFARVPSTTIERSSFDRSHAYKATFDVGQLIPFLVDPVYPGDTYNVKLSGFARLSTPIKPIMDNLYLETFFFFVPYRLVWTNFVRFMGEQDSPGASTSFTIPTITVPFTPVSGDLADYFGLPIGPVYQSPIKISALPFRAYSLIWQQWFKDQNLQNVPGGGLVTGDGPDAYNAYAVRKRGKRHDYFTSCLPFLQKGPAVQAFLAGSAPVIPVLAPLGSTPPYAAATSDAPVWQTPDGSPSNGILRGVGGANPSNVQVNASANWDANTQMNWADTKLKADLSTASASTINDLRQAFQIQKLYERDARGGTRYTEIVRSHFKVVSPDARLQRAEYLGGGSSPIFVTPVAQTTASPAVPTNKDAQGNLAGVGTVSFDGHGFVKSFTEHGILMGILAVRADMTYQQGIERWWTDQTKLDFYWPVLAHLGEQAVLNKEIFFQGTGAAADDQVFGYQERYGHLRYKPGRITGKFRSDVSGSLDVWHLAQDFATLPTLGDTFIQENPPVSRVVAVSTEPQFLFDGFVNMKCARPMPVFGVPGLIDHF